MIEGKEGKALGRKLWLALKCGTFDMALEVLEQIVNLPEDSLDKDEALEYCDARRNSHLHLACSFDPEGTQIQDKHKVIAQLLKLGFILDDKNLDGKTCLDLCSAGSKPDVLGLQREKRRDCRGNSIFAEYRNFHNVSEAGFLALAAVKFKGNLAKGALARNANDSPEKGEQLSAAARAIAIATGGSKLVSSPKAANMPRGLRL